MAAAILQYVQAPEQDGKYAVKVGIIGGTGLDDPDLMENRTEKKVSTPFGEPSDVLVSGTVSGVPVVMVARHGRSHSIMPTNINNRANIYALKAEGCTHLMVSTACGILKEEIKPGDFVLLDSFIDRTTKRHQTFYDGDVAAGHPKGVCHIPMADPFCPEMRKIVQGVADSIESITLHPKGTMVTIEGPRFSSRAESHFFRLLNADVINMTTCPEVVLANEAGLSYCAIAMATDYDCWREGEAGVDIAEVLRVMKDNAIKMKELWLAAIGAIGEQATKEATDTRQAPAKNNIMGGE